MRRAIIAHLEAGGEGLGAMGKEAVRELAAREAAVR
jgi:hypothetical protein